jgi:uncharacterized protein (DUF2147 family)
MKRLLAIIALIILPALMPAQASEGDKIIGLWLTGSGKAHIQVTRYGEKYGGKIVWIREPNDALGHPKRDSLNPDPAKRNNPRMGLNILLGFKYAGDKKYEDGTIYDPENGKTYKCVMELADENALKVRGYIGISLIGRTDTWTRVK